MYLVIVDSLNQLECYTTHSSKKIRYDLVYFPRLNFAVEAVIYILIYIHEVVEDSITISDNFRMPLGQNWNRSIGINTSVRRLQVFFFQSIYHFKIDLSIGYIADGKKCTSVLAEIVAPNLDFLLL